MNLAAWLRFCELSLLAAWLGWRLLAPTQTRRFEAGLPGLAALAGAGQLILGVRAASDPLTSPWQILPELLATVFGSVSLVVVLASCAAAVWLMARRDQPSPALGQTAARRRSNARLAAGSRSLPAVAALALVLAGVSTAGAADTISALASSGQIAMSPTLSVPRAALSIPNPYATDPASGERGRMVYQQNCAACHGINGDGNGPAGASLRIRPATFRNPQHFAASGMDGAHFWTIQHGDGQPGGMPAWQGVLTDQQMWNVLNYVKQLAGVTPRP